jgi:hypothetical protein
MTSRRDLLTAPLGLALGPDAALSVEPGLAALHKEWLLLQQAMKEASGALSRAEASANAQGASWDECPAVQSALRTQHALDGKKRRIARKTALTPASSLLGLALKMSIWRSESAVWANGAFENLDEVYAFSVYRDLFRVTGLVGRSEALDQKSLNLLRCGRFLSGERK